MKLTVNNKTFWVRWQYDDAVKIRLKDEYPVKVTTCIIETEGFEIVSVGNAHTGKNERFIKDTGRKISLARALQVLWPSRETFMKNLKIVGDQNKPPVFLTPPGNIEEICKQNKEIRKQFWQKYFNK